MKIGPAEELPDHWCPRCHTKFDRVSGIGGKFKPSPGDVSLCIECASLAVFDDHLQLREPTLTELLRIQQSEYGQVAEIVECAIKQFRAQKAK